MDNQNIQNAGESAKQIGQIGQAESIDFGSGSITIEKDAISSAIISGNGNRVVIYQYQVERKVEEDPSARVGEIGPNPYKGLLAFQETDGDRFFGRSKQIEQLWDKFRSLHEGDSTIRLLPIYGPSGSGKSSLARAGLIPELARRPLPGYAQARVAVLVPGTHPLEALASVLARVATDDPTPVAKTREFAGELKQANEGGEYDGLRRIADVLPDIATSPLIVLVDQLEEVYSLCENQAQRDAFISNLLIGASSRSRHVSVIVTLRSDFLGEAQKHPGLNPLFTKPGFLVPAMDKEELRQAICQPAELAGHRLDKATVELLIKDTQGREGALPLLQFALTRIWEGLVERKEPAETLTAIGGVGGALAGEAQRIYESLSSPEQDIARRVFLGLVQLGEGSKDTRRRTEIKKIVSQRDTPEQVKQVIARFSAPGARLITLAANANAETAEVTHEALFEHWRQLQDWLDSSRSDIRFGRRLDDAAEHWDKNDRPEGNLWRSPDLDLLTSFAQRSDDDLNDLQLEFFQASQKVEKQRKRQELIIRYGFSVLMGVIAFLLFLFFWQKIQAQKNIDAVFLSTNALDILPSLEKSANDREKLDDFQFPDNADKSIEYYHQHQAEINILFAYYRNILTTTRRALQDKRLLQENPQYESQLQAMADRAEKSLSGLLSKYRIPQLKSDLGKKNFGKYLEKPVTEYEQQYSKGSALRTTYEILFTTSGAGADLNKDGFVGDKQEASQMPCQTLHEIENLWRNATGGRCGWYNRKGHYANDNDCKELDGDRSTLYTSIFGHNTDEAIDRIKQCGIPPR